MFGNRNPLREHSGDTLLRVVMPTVTTEDTLTVTAAQMGLSADRFPNGGFAVIWAKATVAGVHDTFDETLVVNDDGELVITEGANGFITGDIYLIYVSEQQIIDIADGVASTA